MRVLLDECLPKQLWRSLKGHSAWTVQQKGWSGKRNGELLSLMSSNGFQVLLTADQSIVNQQNLKAAGVSLIAMIGRSLDIKDLLPLMPSVLLALDAIQPGDAIEIRSP